MVPLDRTVTARKVFPTSYDETRSLLAWGQEDVTGGTGEVERGRGRGNPKGPSSTQLLDEALDLG